MQIQVIKRLVIILVILGFTEQGRAQDKPWSFEVSPSRRVSYCMFIISFEPGTAKFDADGQAVVEEAAEVFRQAHRPFLFQQYVGTEDTGPVLVERARVVRSVVERLIPDNFVANMADRSIRLLGYGVAIADICIGERPPGLDQAIADHQGSRPEMRIGTERLNFRWSYLPRYVVDEVPYEPMYPGELLLRLDFSTLSDGFLAPIVGNCEPDQVQCRDRELIVAIGSRIRSLAYIMPDFLSDERTGRVGAGWRFDIKPMGRLISMLFHNASRERSSYYGRCEMIAADDTSAVRLSSDGFDILSRLPEGRCDIFDLDPHSSIFVKVSMRSNNLRSAVKIADAVVDLIRRNGIPNFRKDQ